MTGKDVAYIAGTLAAGFVAYRLFKTASKITDAGGKVVDGIVQGAREILTVDLNPASNQNIIYRGANVITGGDSSTSLGSRIYDWLNPEYNPNAVVAPVQANIQARLPAASTESSQALIRRSELQQQNIETARIREADTIMSDRRNSFRLGELNQEPLRAYSTDYDQFAAPMLAQSTGA